MGTIECAKCKEFKTVDNFYKANNRKRGYQTYCKDCSRKRRRDYAKTKQGKENQRRYDSSQKRKEAAKRTQAKHKQKKKVVAAVNHLVRTGRIPSPKVLPCKHCGKQAREYHHHKGYSEAHKYNVIPLCRACHVKEHM